MFCMLICLCSTSVAASGLFLSSPNRSPPSALRLLAPSPFADASLAENAKPGRNASRRQLVQRPRLFWERNSTRRQLSQIGGGCAAGLGSVSLVNQASYSPCIAGRSFGCRFDLFGRLAVWVKSCRGSFRCADRNTTTLVQCGYPPGRASYICPCSEGVIYTQGFSKLLHAGLAKTTRPHRTVPERPGNGSCQVTLVKQASNAKCIQGRSYGCEIAHDGQAMIWVHNCRGKFRCAGRKKNVDCGTWDKPEGSTCACDPVEQLDVTRARFADFYPWLEEEVEQENASRFCFGNMDWQGNCNALPNAPGAPRDDQLSAFPC